jgi:predicted nucleic acid-binding protein
MYRDAFVDIVLDASPLIYLAKLDAFDALAIAGHTAVVPPSVYAEAARPELAFRHPEIATIERVRSEGQLDLVTLEAREAELAADLAGRYGGLHAGELEVLALGLERGWAVCFHERQAARLARALGVSTIHLVEILFAGTPDLDLLELRIRHFARLTNLTMDDLDVLLDLIRERRR